MGYFDITKTKFAACALLLMVSHTGVLRAAQYAVLNTGCRVRIERHHKEGEITHLFLPGGGVTRVNSTEIVRIETDEYVPPPPPPPAPSAPKEEQPKAEVTEAKDSLGEVDLHGLDPVLVHSIIQAESGGNPAAVSRSGARGLMQLTPATARRLKVQNAFDPAQNVEGGTRYLRELLERYGDLRMALAAYNAGPHKVDAYGRVPPYRETQSYVRRIINEFNRRKQAQLESD